MNTMNELLHSGVRTAFKGCAKIFEHLSCTEANVYDYNEI